jgi:acetyl/propionyl-CoA carboxylase alpha subunit/acetyl-CoA carboxylase carboxyltransferase component
MKHILIANRGEIAIRIARAIAEVGMTASAVYAEDDAASLHVRRVDHAVALPGVGPAAYLDIAAVIRAAREIGADAIHPGYGFLSENPVLGRAVADAGMTFIGPSVEALGTFGDKAAARALAERVGVPVVPGTKGGTDLAGARAFMDGLGPNAAIMVKAVSGGGGRGMRPVLDPALLEEAMERCRSEAEAAFGDGDVYVERLVPAARHIEVQVAGDGFGHIIVLGDRDCSLQRRRQKIVEVAPAPGLTDVQRGVLAEHSIALAKAADYQGLGTVEFLLGTDGSLAFIEFNARLQVEHTVTEAVTGLDLVRLQIDIADGLNLEGFQVPTPRGSAIQARVNLEKMQSDGSAKPGGGRLDVFEPPAGPGVRVDHFGYAGYQTSPRYDSMLAKVIVHAASGGMATAAMKTSRALAEFRLEGAASNIAFLQCLLDRPEWQTYAFDVDFVEREVADILKEVAAAPRRHFQPEAMSSASVGANLAGARIDAADPLAVLAHGKAEDAGAGAGLVAAADEIDGHVLRAPMPGAIVSLDVAPGDEVWAGRVLLVMDSMKMEHEIAAEVGGIVRRVDIAPGDTVFEGSPLVVIEEADVAAGGLEEGDAVDLDLIRPDLAEVEQRRALGHDASRPDAVAKRRKTNSRTARENVEDLVDPGSFIEYGSMVIAARRSRTPIDELIRRTPHDGMVGGIGQVNGALLPDADTRCMVISYDYMVLAGTQGKKNHQKKDRLFRLAEQYRLPVIFLAEGGGGRPGDTDGEYAGNLQTPAFHLFGKLSGNAPMVGIVSGRCFAGNAVILGCCDVTIATESATIGMGGPAMIEGGGLGVFRPEEVGPSDVMRKNGVIDISVKDEAEAVAAAKKYLSYFQGPLNEWEVADQRLLRHVVPENRLRVYEVRRSIELIADIGSVLEIRKDFGVGMVTALARIEGRPIGIIANNPRHIGGAIDSEAADKAARFMQLCDAHDLPILSLCDTPGNMVGPEAEKTALVRHCCRLYVIGANVTVPIFTVVLRKAYGLGAQAMAGGGFHAPFFAVSWPTGEYGGMGLEGAVKLGFRDVLAAIEDVDERRETYERMVAEAYARGKAVNTASLFEIDDVIDPADTRRWIMGGILAMPPKPVRSEKKRPWIDTW